MNRYNLDLPGHRPNSVGVLKVHAPYDGGLLAEVECADADAIEKAFNNAEAVFSDRKKWLPTFERVGILERAATLAEERADALALAAAKEGGKPLADSRTEIARAVEGIRYCAAVLKQEGGREVPMGVSASSVGKLAFTSKEPIGIVVAVSAFNHPFNLIAHQVAPAVAVGCPVIIKPASDTPISCHQLVRMFREAGLPKAWCQALVVRDRKLAASLASDRRVAFLSFVGSAEVGWQLRSKLAPGTRAALEHGGIAPAIVLEDADTERLLPKVLRAGFYHAGQVCVSLQRLFVHASIAKSLSLKLAEKAKALQVGDPSNPKTDVGPLIRSSEVDRVHKWVVEATDAGARLLCGGKQHKTCYEPTILYNPPEDAKVSQEEIFGPVVCVYPFEDEAQAVAQANRVPYAFQASIFTQNLDRAMYHYRHLNASTVLINEHPAFRVDWMPFAGLKQSGLGTGGMPHTMEDMQVNKLLVLDSPSLE